MSENSSWIRAAIFAIVLISLPLHMGAKQEGEGGGKKLSREELAQLLAPIALYPDELIAQILMASTYPLEIVQADRWVQQNRNLKGDALTKALEKEKWDPSVKSLVNFPSVLSAMSQKLDLTSQVGDAFLDQPKEVMGTIQELRKKAQEAGNLKTTKEQKVVVEKETIVIKPADPQVVYVPAYSPTVVYGTWMYPAYPPYYYYPPPPPVYPAYHFAAGVAVGAAWGYAWGHCNWHGGTVNYNVNQNININHNINRSQYSKGGQIRQGGQGSWQHNPEHRRNVAYRTGTTAQKYGQSPARAIEGRRDARGYGASGGGVGASRAASPMDRGGKAGADRGASRSYGGSRRDSAFSGGFGSGNEERLASERGRASRISAGSGSSFRGGGASGAGGTFRSGRGFGGGRRR